jgi:uncharacterized protein YigE (DUF2233 family)
VRKLSVAFAFCLCISARAEWAIQSEESEFSAERRIEHRHVVVSSGAAESTLELALFGAKSATLHVVDNAAQDSDLAAAMAQHHCLAGVNGGYFDPQFAPIGLRVVDGSVTSPLIRARLLTGVLSASRDRGIELTRIGEFSRNRKVDAAMECGPFLVDLAARVRGLDNTRSARRTFAAVARGGRAALGYCDSATLAELSEMLATVRLADGFAVDRAMNLDGGSSSAFWFRREDGSAFAVGEQKTVRDFIGVVAR